MKRKFIPILCLIVFCHFKLTAQLSTEHLALNNLRKLKWERAAAQLRKAMLKDSANAAAKYVYALYFFAPKNPNSQVDSAHHYALEAMANFSKANPKQRDRMKRFPLDSTIITMLHKQIDSTAFEQAKQINTENAYLHFLERFTNASQRDQAIELRDEAAYLDALKKNTYRSFVEFIDKYPKANRADEARKRYEKLLFESKTHDKRLASYELFLREFPGTPYRREVEKNIYEISTASGNEEKITAFIKNYPNSFFSARAKKILFHILLEKEPVVIPDFLLTDSIRQIQSFEHGYLVPFYEDDKFGFMDGKGNDVIPPATKELAKEYLCGNITEDVLVLSNKIIAKNGAVIFNGNIEELDDLGFGFLKVGSEGHTRVVHKAGFSIDEPELEDVKLLNGKFLALKKEKWALFTLTGRKLMPYEWDEISNVDNVLVFKKNGKFKVATADQLGLLADQQNLNAQDSFDEIKPWHKNLIWARTGNNEGVLDQALGIVIPFEKQSLDLTFLGTVSSTSSGKKIYPFGASETGGFQSIRINKPWLIVKQINTWRLFDPILKKFLSPGFDSIAFKGPFAVGRSGDTLRVFFTPEKSIEFNNATLDFIPGKDSTSFLMVCEGEKKSLYDARGQKLFAGLYDRIQFAGQGLFIVVKKEKKGLVSLDGKSLLPVEYDAIGSASNDVISLLKSMKFGLYDISSRKLIKPQYDKNLTPYNDKLVVAFKDGLYGFIDWDGNSKNKFEFEEIRYWNDSAAWVKNNFQWMLYNIDAKTILLDKIKDYKVIADVKGEKLAIIHQENKYGVINSKSGTVIPTTFSDIKNLGRPEQPLYFTEKHVEEASIFVVIYYNKEGKLVRRHVYEEEDYERIYCQGN